MGYLFLGAALLCGVTKGYCGKRSSGYVTEFRDSLLINLIRMVLCILFGCVMLGFGQSFSELAIDGTVLLITAISGVTTSVFVITWLLSVRRGAYMLVDVFLMLGVMVAILLCWGFFGESVTVRQGIGFFVLLGAVILMCSYQRAIKGKITLPAILLLVMCGVSTGLTDFSQKWFVRAVADKPVAVFQFYTYLFSAITLLIFYVASGVLARRRQTVSESGERQPRRGLGKKLPLALVGYILVMAICLYLHSYFKTKAAGLLTATQLYPLNQGGALLLSTVMAAVCFHEKPRASSVIGLILAFAALLLINL